jgi:hypothetical protein
LKALVSHVIPGNPTDHPNPNAPFAPRGIVLSHPYSVNLLSAPEGIVFGPDGNLYVISYSGLGGVDRVLIFAGPDKPNRRSFLDKIDFADPNHPELRVAGSALLFGPGGGLYVPITGQFALPHSAQSDRRVWLFAETHVRSSAGRA